MNASSRDISTRNGGEPHVRRWGLLIAVIAGWLVVTLVIGALTAYLAVVAPSASACPATPPAEAESGSLRAVREIPAQLRPIYQAAGQRYGLGPGAWSYLAAINKVETDFGRNLANSGAGPNGGAKGWMQFEDATWTQYGVDSPLDGLHDAPNRNDPGDAIFSAARLLAASGAPGNWPAAIFAYNHSQAYVARVNAIARSYAVPSQNVPLASPAEQSSRLIRVGLATTYGWDPVTGYRDPNDRNNPALVGATNNTPGISLYDRSTLGGWWLVKDPHGTSAILQQTDLGPAPFTGVLVDINAVAARVVFHLPQGAAFPSRQGNWTLTYLGSGRPPGAGTVVGIGLNGSGCSAAAAGSETGILSGVSVSFPLPAGAAGSPGTWTLDQGVDITAAGHTPLLAVGAGTVVLRGIRGFGADAPVLALDQPIGGYRAVYYGHAGPGGAVPLGTHVRAGAVIGEVGAGIVGISTGPHLEIGFAELNGNPVGRSSHDAMRVLLRTAYAQAGLKR